MSIRIKRLCECLECGHEWISAGEPYRCEKCADRHWEDRESRGFVYVVGAIFVTDAPTALVKIGYTKDLKTRVAVLREPETNEKVDLLTAIPTEAPRLLEAALHKKQDYSLHKSEGGGL